MDPGGPHDAGDEDGKNTRPGQRTVRKNLNSLGERGLSRRPDEDLHAPVIGIAQARYPDLSLTDAVRETITDAIDHAGIDDSHKEAAKQHFGIGRTKGGDYEARRVRAAAALGIKISTYKDHRQRQLLDEVASSLERLPVAPAEQRSGESPTRPKFHWSYRRVLGAVLAIGLVVAVLFIATEGNGTSDPGRPHAIDAETGKLIPQPKLTPLSPDDAGLGSGPVLQLCDLTHSESCPSDYPTSPVAVRVGDVIEFFVMLHNPHWMPLPLFRVYVQLAPMPARTMSLEADFTYPVTVPPHCNGSCPSEIQEFSEPLRLQVTGAHVTAALRYIQGSTWLGTNKHLFARIPDGITTDPGLLMAHLGVPNSICYDCTQDYSRWLVFRARVDA